MYQFLSEIGQIKMAYLWLMNSRATFRIQVTKIHHYLQGFRKSFTYGWVAEVNHC